MEVDMMRVSSSGQIFLPTKMRKALSISEGDFLAAYATDEAIVLKPVRLPTVEEFSAWLDEARAWAAEAGYGEEDMAGIVKSVRRKKRT